MFDKNILNSHAILIVGSSVDFEAKIRKEIENQKKDERFFDLATFGIDESHELIRLSSALDKPTSFFIKTLSITSEAQNALLKLTEEPSKLFQIIIVIPSDQSILSTFKSRFRVVFVDRKTSGSALEVKRFLQASLPERLKMLEPYIEHPVEEDDIKSKKEFFLNFLNDLHEELGANSSESLKALSLVDSYGGMSAPSFRMFFEYLATSLPSSFKN